MGQFRVKGETVENNGEIQLSERQALIYNMLKVNGENSARSLARILNLSQRTVEREISFLRNHGFIDKDGTKNGGGLRDRYEVNPQSWTG